MIFKVVESSLIPVSNHFSEHAKSRSLAPLTGVGGPNKVYTFAARNMLLVTTDTITQRVPRV